MDVKYKRNKMKTNEEYWKQRCLLAESMLEEKISPKVLESTAIATPHSITYNAFINLLESNRLGHFYFTEMGQSSIRVFDKEDNTIFSIGASRKERVYELALKELKEHLNKTK